jgi:hypothetical protein
MPQAEESMSIVKAQLLSILWLISKIVLSKKWVTLSVLEESVVVWGEIGAS